MCLFYPLQTSCKHVWPVLKNIRVQTAEEEGMTSIPEEPVMTHLTLCLSLHLIYHLKEKETRNRMKD